MTATAILCVLLPIRAESVLNLREHWRAKHKRTSAHRDIAKWHCIKASKDRPALPATITLTRIAPRPLDSHDNLQASLKATVDGICDYLQVKDNDERLTWAYAQRRGDVKQYAVEVVMEFAA